MGQVQSLNFPKFNEVVNPNNGLVYVPLHNKSPINGMSPKSFDDMKLMSNKDANLEIGLLIPKGLIVINIDNRQHADMILRIIQDRNEKVLVVNTPKGIHIYAKSSIKNNTRNNLLCVGLPAGTLSEDIGKSYVVTPFKNPKKNTNLRLKKMDILHYNGISKLPCWLTPIHSSDSRKPIQPPYTLPFQDVENELIAQLTRIKFTRLTANERADTIDVINEYMASSPLSDKDIEDILVEHNDDRLPETQFFDKTTFLHWRLGDYLIDYTHAVKNAVKKTLNFYNERKQVYSEDESYLKGIITNMIPSLTDNRKNEVIKHMDSKLSLNPVLMNQDSYLINFKNGILDIETMQFHPHSPDFYGTIQLNVDYNPNAYNETADEFFTKATRKDKEVEQLLFEAIGYSFLKTIELAKVFILTGSGRNGKSTFLDLIREIVGLDNATTIDFRELSSDFGTAGLADKLVSLAGDISNERITDADIFKKVASGDLIRVNEKYKAKYDIVPITTLFFSANEIPKSADTTYAFYRRLVIVPFHADLSDVSEVEGKLFKRKLISEESKQYVTYKAVQAIHNVLMKSQDFITPKVVERELEQYRIGNSSTLQWARAVQTTTETLNNAPALEIYSAYKEWCDLNGRKHKGFNKFIYEMEIEYERKYSEITQRFVSD